MQRRNWVPDVEMVADQLIENYRSAAHRVGGPSGDPSKETVIQGDAEAINTMTSWIAKAEEHGYDSREDDWFALVQACRTGGCRAFIRHRLPSRPKIWTPLSW